MIVGVWGLTFECAELSVWSASDGKKQTGKTLPGVGWNGGGCVTGERD
jgi:hypothetical protein